MFTARLFRPTIISPLRILSPARSFSLKPRLPKLPNLKLTPDAPGNIVGTVNDAYVPPPAEFSEGSFHWAYERMVVLAMTPLVVFPFVAGVDYPLIDATLGVLLALHSRYGFESCIVDYIPLRKFGNWHKLALFFLNIGTCLSIYGIYVIETEENGICDLVKKVWHA